MILIYKMAHVQCKLQFSILLYICRLAVSSWNWWLNEYTVSSTFGVSFYFHVSVELGLSTSFLPACSHAIAWTVSHGKSKSIVSVVCCKFHRIFLTQLKCLLLPTNKFSSVLLSQCIVLPYMTRNCKFDQLLNIWSSDTHIDPWFGWNLAHNSEHVVCSFMLNFIVIGASCHLASQGNA